MTIRTATVSDAALLTELSATTMREAFGPPHNPAELVEEYVQSAITEARLTAELADPRSTFFLLLNDQQSPIGYAKMRRHAPPRRMRERNAVEIQRIYLLQDQIGQGQGRYLMDYCLQWATQAGYRAVWLGVWERNERALGFYRKLGFERFGYHYFLFGSERQRDFWLQKQLTS
ncbi:GNAT family N-acetyltransferase [Spirosoma taeanense]|uniref:GNAT family N-acetyltransferase n=1 Tax=Spirosoma taeanense TaxID=2735870 RepID=A0A6M5Y7N0_9BACT|nr:GNAT family N-acetyltransferase [Spirosoma taeanense]QJW88732.1 GNAT family N-acetyltransferase [Spirosoma taeanense]